MGHVAEGGRVETIHLVTHSGRAHKLALEPGAPTCFMSCGEDGAVRCASTSEMFWPREAVEEPKQMSATVMGEKHTCGCEWNQANASKRHGREAHRTWRWNHRTADLLSLLHHAKGNTQSLPGSGPNC